MAQGLVRGGDPAAATAVPGRRVRRRAPAFGRTFVAIALVLELVVAVALSLWAFGDVRALALAIFDMDQSVGTDEGVNLTEVARNPEAMLGRTVTISGEVAEPPGERMLILGEDAPLVGDKVVVVVPGALSALLSEQGVGQIDEGTVLEVTGDVILREDARLQFGLTRSEVDDAAQLGKGVVVAESIRMNPNPAFGLGDKEFPAWSDGYDLGLTAYDIAHYTDAYLGTTVTISGEIEEGVLTEHVFEISDFQILVVARKPQAGIFVEATAYVTGEVRRFDRAALEAELGIVLDERLAEREGQPVIVAETVEVVA